MKNKQIHGLRGLSILMVVITHFFLRYRLIYHEGFEQNKIFAQFSFIGVACFLLISGYYMESGSKGGAFLKKRLLNLWPKYFFAISIIFIVTRFVELPGRTVDLTGYLLNIPLINGFVNEPYVDAAHWYLTTLVACIFWYFILLRLAEKKRLIGYIIWITVITILYILTSHLEGTVNDALGIAENFLGGKYAAVIVLGTLLKRNERSVLYFLLAAICLTNSVIILGIVQSVEIVFCAGVVYLAGKEKLRILDNPVFSFFGNISYSVYLLHQNLGYILMRALETQLGYQEWMPVVAIFFGILIGFIFETLYNFIAKKIRRT